MNAPCLFLQRLGVDDLAPPRRRTGHQIAEAMAVFHRLRLDDLKGPSQARMYAWPRQEAMWIIRQETDLSLPQIGRIFNRDHTTVLHGVRAHQKRLDEAEQARVA